MVFRMVDGLITSIHAVIICDPTCTPPAAAGAAGSGGAAPGAAGASGGAGAAGEGGPGGSE
jgi:hypothetical protein